MEEKLMLKKSARVWVNEYYEKENYILLKVFRKDLTESYNVLIDKSDFKRVSKGQWYVFINRKDSYLKDMPNILWTNFENGKKHVYGIHQWILNTKDKNIIIDHKSTNRYDNRRCNLRISNSTENAINQTYKGYNFDNKTNKYLTRIKVNNKQINMGRYETEKEAETIYLKAFLLLGYDKISEYHNNRINKLHIKLNNDDLNNKYLKKIYYLVNGINKEVENGKFNYNYEKNMDIIIDLVNKGYNWKNIALYLKTNIEGLECAKGETVKKKYLNYINNKNYV